MHLWYEICYLDSSQDNNMKIDKQQLKKIICEELENVISEAVRMQQSRSKSREKIGWPMHSEDSWSAYQAARAADTSERSWENPIELEPIVLDPEVSEEEHNLENFMSWLNKDDSDVEEGAPMSVDPEYHSLD